MSSTARNGRQSAPHIHEVNKLSIIAIVVGDNGTKGSWMQKGEVEEAEDIVTFKMLQCVPRRVARDCAHVWPLSCLQLGRG